MKKIIILASLIFLFSASGDCGDIKYRIYKKNKTDKVEKYRAKLQRHYDATHTPGTPWIISVPVDTWDDKKAIPLVGTGCPENDGDDGVVDNIDPPAGEGE